MPLQGEYSWSEKKDSLKVSVALKGVSASKVDISGMKFEPSHDYLLYTLFFPLVSAQTLKVNYNPYILDIVLSGEVDSLKHKAAVKDGVLFITLFKKEAAFWGQCESEDILEVLQAKRLQALKAREELDAQLSAQMKDRRIAEERTAVRQQMSLDESERYRIEQTKQDEKDAAEREMYEAFSQMKSAEVAEKKVTSNDNKTVKRVAWSQEEEAPQSALAPVPPKGGDIFNGDDIANEDDCDMLNEIDEDDDIDNNNDESTAQSTSANFASKKDVQSERDEDIRYIPAPRSHAVVDSDNDGNKNSSGKVRINFTPRVFPTPMRESKAAEEEDWIAKNRRHLKNHGVLGRNVSRGKNGSDISEEDPAWLKAKGDDFFRAGDIKSALNAYSAALDIDEAYAACYSNRSACYLQSQLFDQCKLDCDIALQTYAEELQKLSTADAKDGLEQLSLSSTAAGADDHERMKMSATIVKLLVRRGGALCQLGRYTESLSDYRQALVKYQQLSMTALSSIPSIAIASLEADIDRLKLLSQADSLKKEGDALFAEQKAEEAVSKYDLAVKILPVHVSALSNRSACKMVLGQVEGAVKDCELALSLLRFEDIQSQQQQQVISLGKNNTDGSVLKSMMSAVLPPPGSDKRKQWLLRTLLRKAVALMQLQRLSEATVDYKEALRLDPENKQLQADVANLEKTIKE